MNYKQACQRLKHIANMGSKLGLVSVSKLCARLGNPQDQLNIVHVAGTNGKGSVCAMTSSILTAAGYKTGLYVSPFLKTYRDSFSIDGKTITPADFAKTAAEVFEQVDILNQQGVFPTEFEILTAMAFVWYQKRACDVVVLETGLGGRLDATNVVSHPLVSVITAISMDHMDYLGATLEAIAQEKCGIIKPGGITVCYPLQEASVLQTIHRFAITERNTFILPDTKRINSIAVQIGRTGFDYKGISYETTLGGYHQAYNAATAMETVRALAQYHSFNIPPKAISLGLIGAYLPARQEVLSHRPLVVLDGAHNIQSIQSLADTIHACAPQRPVAVVMGILKDKEYESCIRIMASLCDMFIAVRPNNPRALDAGTTAAVAAKYCARTAKAVSFRAAVSQAASFCGHSGTIVLCGSLYMADALRRAVTKEGLKII